MEHFDKNSTLAETLESGRNYTWNKQRQIFIDL